MDLNDLDDLSKCTRSFYAMYLFILCNVLVHFMQCTCSFVSINKIIFMKRKETQHEDGEQQEKDVKRMPDNILAAH